MAEIKYAYVSYVDTNERDIVPIENIKNFSIDKHEPRKKYKIKWNNKWYYGSIGFFGESEEEVREKAEKSRPKIISDHLLVSNSESEEPEISNKRKFDEKEANSEQEAVLQKKLKQLTHKLSTTETEKSENEENVRNSPTRNLYSTTPSGTSAASSMNDAMVSADPARIPITTVVSSKEVVSKKKRLFGSINNGEAEDLLNLRLENQKLQRINKDLQQQLKDSQILNVELQKQVINVVGEMQVQLSRLLNKEISVVREDEHLGYPPVAFVKNSDNSIHIGRDVWLKCVIYDTIVFTSTTPSLFVKQMATAVFGGRILKNSSVTGRVSNRKINNPDCPGPRPKLDSTKLMAIEDIFRHWLKNIKNYSSVEVNAFVNKMPTFITKKISQLNTVKKVANSWNDSQEMDFDQTYYNGDQDPVSLAEIKMAAAAATPESDAGDGEGDVVNDTHNS